MRAVTTAALAALAVLAITAMYHHSRSTTVLEQRETKPGMLAANRVREVAARLRTRINNGERSAPQLASRRATGGVHVIRKKALTLSGAAMLKVGSRETELANAPAKATKLSAAEEARCVGMLHACQSWLELKDGDKNDIVITSPDDDTKELFNKHVVLPGSGQPIPQDVWDVLKDSCKYGLSDLRQCDKPDHWPLCTGSSCTGKNAKNKPPSRGTKANHH